MWFSFRKQNILCRNIENQKQNWFRFRNQTRHTKIKNEKTIGACKVEEQKRKTSEKTFETNNDIHSCS